MRRVIVVAAAALGVGVSGCGGGAPATVTVTVTSSSPAVGRTTASASTSTSTTSSATTSAGEPVDDWSALTKRLGPSVVRLSTSSCGNDPYMGSGFAVGPDLVMTAAHITRDARTVSVQEGSKVIGAVVLGQDLGHDVAVLRTQERLDAAPLRLADSDATQGTPLAVLGYPLQTYSLRLSTGIVSGDTDPVDYGDQTVDPVFVTDAATNGGNSGGPVLDHDGRVIGLVSGGQFWTDGSENRRPVAGTNFIVPASALRPHLLQWAGRTQALPTGCDTDVQPPSDWSAGDLTLQIDSDHKDAPAIGLTLYGHGAAISDGSYSAAWSWFTARMQRSMGNVGAWSKGLYSSYWDTVDVRSVMTTSAGEVARVVLVTRQDAEQGHEGQTCSVWTIDYTMVNVGGIWLIDKAKAAAEPAAC